MSDEKLVFLMNAIRNALERSEPVDDVLAAIAHQFIEISGYRDDAELNDTADDLVQTLDELGL